MEAKVDRKAPEINFKCTHERCNRNAIKCWRVQQPGRIEATYCDHHSHLHGFCTHCGVFESKILLKGVYQNLGLCSTCYSTETF